VAVKSAGNTRPIRIASARTFRLHCPGQSAEGTKSYALLMFDPKAVRRRRQPLGGLCIPVSVTGSPKARSRSRATNMSAPKHDEAVELFRTLHATRPAASLHLHADRDRSRADALKEGMTREEVIKALDGHAKSATGLIGIFSKHRVISHVVRRTPGPIRRDLSFRR